MSADDGDIAAMNTGPEPTAESAIGEFNIRISLNGIVLGWWTDNGSPEWWITVVPEQSDSTTWTQISSSDDGTYLQKSKNNYLSYRPSNVYATGLKMRDWAAAARWKLEGKNLRALDNGNLVGRDGDSFYCNGKNVVEVEFVAK
jgi:hypothetical protein